MVIELSLLLANGNKEITNKLQNSQKKLQHEIQHSVSTAYEKAYSWTLGYNIEVKNIIKTEGFDCAGFDCDFIDEIPEELTCDNGISSNWRLWL